MPEVLEQTRPSQVKEHDSGGLPPEDSGHQAESISALHFKLTVFEGPLDLLLHLIKESKIDIYDIPIVDITQQYLGYIALLKELDLEIAGEFLVMAATLIHIKSKMLLPPDEEDKQEAVEDPRAELVQRLLEYQAYKESSQHLRKREELWKNIFRRSAPDTEDMPHDQFGAEPILVEATVFDLISSFRKLLAKAPPQVLEITRETLTVADKINFIVGRLEEQDGVKFEALFEEGHSRMTLIVTFLALLEIIRLGLARLYQEKDFGSIWILRPQERPDAVPAEESLPAEQQPPVIPA
ncbi:MAG: segregation/condensation protein A [Nitrospiraceae bacterium]|nr:MAG: segregation/condensation protein A [Nitrospiraceae bacterium]